MSVKLTENLTDDIIVGELKNECDRISAAYSPAMLDEFHRCWRRVPAMHRGDVFFFLEALSASVSNCVSRQLARNLPGLIDRLMADKDFVHDAKAMQWAVDHAHVDLFNDTKEKIRAALRRQGIPVDYWMDPQTGEPNGILPIIGIVLKAMAKKTDE